MTNKPFHAPSRSTFPAVSVIIPLYNAEKYIDECLDSILAQTFKNFELIVVDDCSTDNSVAIVESYVEKFGGRMILTSLKKNSGNAGYTARNKGFTFSRGEYVYFMDADDFITETAFEELYTAAKHFDADVVYTGSRYRHTTKNGTIWTTDGIGRELRAKGIEDKPALTINDPHKNLEELSIKAGLYWSPWTKLVRRNFLTENEITFYEVLSGGDHLWTIELFTCAKRLLRIPNAVYFWRDDAYESMTRNKRTIDKQIYTWSKAFLSISNATTDLSNKLEFLKANPIYCYGALINHFNFFMEHSIEARLQVESKQVYEILRREFEDKDGFDLMIPFFFSVVDSQQKTLLFAQQELDKFSKTVAQDKARIAELERRDKENKAYISELENFIKGLKRKGLIK